MDLFDVIVIGGGHAGCEAAAAAARSGARTALLTTAPTKIGAMSCNPAIGGVGKGHLVREVDCFDGLIGIAADAAAIHYRLLNRSKGAAVHGPRVQADRRRFACSVQAQLGRHANLSIRMFHVEQLFMEAGRVCGVIDRGGTILRGRAVVLATGTFLGGRLHRGNDAREGGREGDAPADRLASQLRDLGLPLGRLKTGTPPRLDGRTIDWGKLERQPSDADAWTMSPLGRRILPQLACGVTRTNPRTHEVIRHSLDKSAMFSGAIEGRGPRYCPSVEDKVVRFGDRDGHQIFLEPEGLDDALVYPNGISTSLPADVQEEFVRSIAGLECARIVQPGYAVEYDYLDPRALDNRLHLAPLPGLFFAGQVNGTTGYEEAAAQGLVAGLNAAALALDRAPALFDRTSSYIGVMIDDLTLNGVTEPYRMLTARAEYRLILRADNAVSRLGERAIASGAVSTRRRRAIESRLADIASTTALLGKDASAPQIARGTFNSDAWLSDHAGTDREVLDEVVETLRYAPYAERQAAEIEQARRDCDRALTLTDYTLIPGLSNEMIERLAAARPATLGDALRIRGITPAALTAILVATRRAGA